MNGSQQPSARTLGTPSDAPERTAPPRTLAGVEGAERAQLIKAAGHPVRARALSIMAFKPSSPKEIADALGLPVANVAYHVRELEKAGLIELVEKRKRRGATEHFYLA